MDRPPETVTANVTGTDTCPWCGNSGWVALKGTTRTGRGPRYERGCAPCRWCELGKKIGVAHQTGVFHKTIILDAKKPDDAKNIVVNRSPYDFGDYTADDVDLDTIPPPEAKRDQAERAIAASAIAYIRKQMGLVAHEMPAKSDVLLAEGTREQAEAELRGRLRPTDDYNDIPPFTGEEP